MNLLDYLDVFGQPINVGDYIAYASQQGDSPALHIGRVRELTKTKEKKWDFRQKDSVFFPKLRVRSMSPSSFAVGGWHLQTKDTSLGMFDKIVVLTSVPAEVKAILEGFGPV